jgi:hypothetical protein
MWGWTCWRYVQWGGEEEGLAMDVRGVQEYMVKKFVSPISMHIGSFCSFCYYKHIHQKVHQSNNF